MAASDARDPAQQALTLAYEQVIGRDPTAAELALGRQQLAGGTPIASIRAFLADTGYAAAALGRLYGDVVGRAVTAPELAADRRFLAGGGGLADLRGYLSASGEAAGKLRALYLTELGRAITPAELTSDEALIARGASLAAIRGYLSTSDEAVRDLTSRLRAAFAPYGHPATPADIAAAERALADGASLANAVVDNPVATAFINDEYRFLLGVAPSAAQVADIQRGTVGYAGNGEPPVVAAALASPEFAADINAAFQAAVGRPADAVELAAARSELGPSINVATLRTQIAELSGGAPPSFPVPGAPASFPFDSYAVITPQTIAGGSSYAYGLLHNDTLISPRSTASVSVGLTSPGTASIGAFDPATDVLLIQSRQAAGFGDLKFSQSFEPVSGAVYTDIIFGAGLKVTVYVPEASLTPANFRFV